MKIKTQDLTGPALDWAVAKCEGVEIDKFFDAWVKDPDEPHFNKQFKPSTDWAQGGPIIERERIQTTPRGKTTDLWEAIMFDNIFMDDGSDCFQTGPTPLVAAMRCFVASKLGDTIDIPEELL
jgi:hypothetical protein